METEGPVGRGHCVRPVVTLLLAAGVLAFASMLVEGSGRAGPLGTGWPMSNHDAQQTARSEFTGPDTPALNWRLDSPDYAFRTVVTGADGSLYTIAYRVGVGDRV